MIILDIILSILLSAKSFCVDFFIYFIGGITPQLTVLFDFITAHTIMHILLSAKLKQMLPLKNHCSFIEKRIAALIIIGVSQSIDALTGVDAIHNVAIYYFIAMEATYIINIAKELGLPVPQQLSDGIHKFGNYGSSKGSTVEGQTNDTE